MSAIPTELIEALAGGRAFVFPTDTVYGIGAVVTDPTTVPAGLAEVFALKQRDPSKPLPLLIPSIDALNVWTTAVPSYALTLAKQHWPGALTLILNANPAVNPALVNSIDNSIALRVPALELLLELLERVGGEAALLATSANISGQAPAQSIAELDKRFGMLPVLANVDTTNGVPSTIISCLASKPVVVRPGAVLI